MGMISGMTSNWTLKISLFVFAAILYLFLITFLLRGMFYSKTKRTKEVSLHFIAPFAIDTCAHFFLFLLFLFSFFFFCFLYIVLIYNFFHFFNLISYLFQRFFFFNILFPRLHKKRHNTFSSFSWQHGCFSQLFGVLDLICLEFGRMN